MNEKLKPCPFCGVKPKLVKGTHDFYVSHKMDCYIRRFTDTGNWLPEEAVSDWNRRAK